MKYSLFTLMLVLTVASCYAALVSYGPIVFVLLGGCLALAIWEVVQFARELKER